MDEEEKSYASIISEIHSVLEVELNKISTNDYPTQAQRPMNSALNCDKIERKFQFKIPSWKEI